MYLREAGCDAGGWIHLAQEGTMPVVCKSGNEPPGSLKANYLGRPNYQATF